jgi:hypothetical protein
MVVSCFLCCVSGRCVVRGGLGFAYRAENYTINIPRGRFLHRNYYFRPEFRPKSGFAPPYKQKPSGGWWCT